MKFQTIEKCLDFFNLMMVEHEVKNILQCVSLELWKTYITHGSNNETHWDPVKVLTGTHGEIFIFIAQYQGPYKLAIDVGESTGGSVQLEGEVVDILERAVTNDYIPIGLLTAISDHRRDPKVNDDTSSILMTYPGEVESALKMVRLLE